MSRIFAQLFWIKFLVLSIDGLPANVMRDSSKGLTDVASIFAAMKAQRAKPRLQLFTIPATTLSREGGSDVILGSHVAIIEQFTLSPNML